MDRDFRSEVRMASARTECPECSSLDVVDLRDLLFSRTVNFFRCRPCGCWWIVSKQGDERATRTIVGRPNASVEKEGAVTMAGAQPYERHARLSARKVGR